MSLKNIEKLFSDKRLLRKEIGFFIRKKQIRKIKDNKGLVHSFLRKAKHNLEFFRVNKKQRNFNDWLIVILYYSLYHCALALISKKGYVSKNHRATLLLLIREYSISRREAELIEELSINKEDAELYADLKSERHDASYTTEIAFTKEKIGYYEEKVIDFMNKTEEIIGRSNV
ncbi:MAG: HEPN domain-containing protein [Nanobdellota archaeon]